MTLAKAPKVRCEENLQPLDPAAAQPGVASHPSEVEPRVFQSTSRAILHLAPVGDGLARVARVG
jgi:hypothetical protein